MASATALRVPNEGAIFRAELGRLCALPQRELRKVIANVTCAPGMAHITWLVHESVDPAVDGSAWGFADARCAKCNGMKVFVLHRTVPQGGVFTLHTDAPLHEGGNVGQVAPGLFCLYANPGPASPRDSAGVAAPSDARAT